MRFLLPLLILCILSPVSIQAKEHFTIEHTTIMDASCALQNKRDVTPGCKKNSDAFMKSWHRQAKPVLNALKGILSQSNAQRLEVMFTVNHGGIENIRTSKAMSKHSVEKVKTLLADMKFSLIEGNEFKLKVRSEKHSL